MRYSSKKIIAMAFVGTFVAAGCSSGTHVSLSGDPSPNSSAPSGRIKSLPRAQGGDYGPPPGINYIGTSADAIVVAEVQEIGEPRFNSVDGLPWGDPLRFGEEMRTIPTVYRNVEIKIMQVIDSTMTFQVEVGQVLTIRALGDGTIDEGDQAIPTRSDELHLYYDQFDVMLQPKTTVLVLLREEIARPVYGGGTESYLTPLTGFRTTWRVEGDMAINIDPARSAPIEELLLRILYERSLGIVPERDAGTEDNPLAGDPPPADWKPTEAETEILAPAV